MQHDFIMSSKMSVIKSKMGTIKSKIGRKFEQKRKAKWVKEKANLVKAYLPLQPPLLIINTMHITRNCRDGMDLVYRPHPHKLNKLMNKALARDFSEAISCGLIILCTVL